MIPSINPENEFQEALVELTEQANFSQINQITESIIAGTQALTNEDLLALRKLAKRVSRTPIEGLSQNAEMLFSALFPDPSLPKKSIARLGIFTIYETDCRNKARALVCYNPVLYKHELREGLGAIIGHKCNESTKYGWFIDHLDYTPLSIWWKTSEESEREHVLKKILYLLHQENEFGIGLFNLHDNDIFFEVCKNVVRSVNLNTQAICFINNTRARHDFFFQKLTQSLPDASSALQLRYDVARGPYENLYYALQKVPARFFSEENPSLNCAHLLFDFCILGGNVDGIPFDRFTTTASLNLYLYLFNQANSSTSNLARKVIDPLADLCHESIPKFILEEFLSSSLSIEIVIENFEKNQKKILDFYRIRGRLPQFADDYMAKICNLIKREIPIKENLFVHLVYLRFLNHKGTKTNNALEKTLVEIYKMNKREKLVAKLQRRLEKLRLKQ